MRQAASHPRQTSVSAAGRLTVLLLLIALAVANSLFLYFVVWDLLSQGSLISKLMFSISASAHLLYFFLPWFARDLLAPIVSQSPPPSGRYAYRHDDAPATEVGFLPKLMIVIGASLCVIGFGFGLVEVDPFGWKAKPLEPLISEANCARIGGKIVEIDGKTTCDLGAGRAQ